ncbi:hypothetical protein [Saccharothrix luteola]|uniref:hypothetical protein n=1 Tax=Saccharothrix luteola TaxID=2893018 RepID=UPI001E645DA9|nr:hypothetical protein [Saccharothrix luteola]MCC8248149.1 hypothetical protein [Saccharothrix luteola]
MTNQTVSTRPRSEATATISEPAAAVTHTIADRAAADPAADAITYRPAITGAAAPTSAWVGDPHGEVDHPVPDCPV